MINAVLLSSDEVTRERMTEFISSVEGFSLLGVYSDMTSLMAGESLQDIDVLYADAEYVVRRAVLSAINPMDNKKPVVVVLSNDDADALKCYEIAGVVDYLVATSSIDRLYLSMHKVRTMLSMIDVCMQNTVTSPKNYVFIKVNKKMVRLSLDDIYYVESVKDYIKIVTEKKSFLVYNTLTNFTASLPSSRFARVHRSYTISLDKVEAIDGNTIEILNTRIPFSKKFMKEAFMPTL